MFESLFDLADGWGLNPAANNGAPNFSPPVPEKKRKHKITEQKGRQKINDQINELKALLPECRYVATTKASVLECAVNSLKRYQTLSQTLSVENKKLLRETKLLRAELERINPEFLVELENDEVLLALNNGIIPPEDNTTNNNSGFNVKDSKNTLVTEVNYPGIVPELVQAESIINYNILQHSNSNHKDNSTNTIIANTQALISETNNNVDSLLSSFIEYNTSSPETGDSDNSPPTSTSPPISSVYQQQQPQLQTQQLAPHHQQFLFVNNTVNNNMSNTTNNTIDLTANYADTVNNSTMASLSNPLLNPQLYGLTQQQLLSLTGINPAVYANYLTANTFHALPPAAFQQIPNYQTVQQPVLVNSRSYSDVDDTARVNKRKLFLMLLLLIPIFMSFDASSFTSGGNTPVLHGRPRVLSEYSSGGDVFAAFYYFDLFRFLLYFVLGILGVRWTANSFIWLAKLQSHSL